MTKRHTLPDTFPTLHERDYYSRRIARGDVFRRIAQAQNYIWANQGRIHGMSAYEGRNCTVYDTIKGYSSHTADGIDDKHDAIQLASIMVPDNPGPSRSVDVTVQFGLSATAGFAFTLVAEVYELDGTYTGVHQSATTSTTSATEMTLTVTVPHGRPCQIVVWASYFHSGSATEYATCYYLYAKFTDPTTDQLFGSPVIPSWTLINKSTGLADGDPVSAPLMRTLVRNTLALWSRQWVIANCYLSDQMNSGGFIGSPGYRFTPGPKCTKVDITLYLYQFNASVSGTVNYNMSGGGTLSTTDTINSVGYHTLTHTVTVTPGAVCNLNLRWAGPNSGTTGDWGANLYGVTITEQGADPGIAIPSAFQPIDEELFTADDLIDTTTVLNKLLANDIWLLANRPRVLVSDWCHRTLKRLEKDDAGIIPPEWDWTRGDVPGALMASAITSGGAGFPYGQGGRLANITVCGNNTTADMSGSTSHDNQDGEGVYPDGLANSWSASDTSGSTDKRLWPTSEKFRRHGRRLAMFNITQPASARVGATAPLVHNKVPGARIQTWVRGSRCSPALQAGFAYQNDALGGATKAVNVRPVRGPAPENSFYMGWGSFDIDYNATSSSQILLRPDLRNSAIVPDEFIDSVYGDMSAQWIGPAVEVQPSTPPTTLTIRGRLINKSGSKLRAGTEALEGSVFEMELQSAFVADVPLTQDLLDALDP